MAFDGLVISALVKELNDTLSDGRIMKISQPEKDELIFTIKNYNTYKLFMSADASLPLMYITKENKQAPLNAPVFCMLLRKHFSSAKILGIKQIGLERCIDVEIEHLDEFQDTKVKHLCIEIMGKHSNIILTDDNHTIIDAIKHIPASVSSVREVLPGRKYFIPQTIDKADPLLLSQDELDTYVLSKNVPLSTAIYTGLTGISPLIANEICVRSAIDPDMAATDIKEDIKIHLFNIIRNMMSDVKDGSFYPCMFMKDKKPVEFSCLHLLCFEKEKEENIEIKPYETISDLLFDYFSLKNIQTRIRQKSTDLRKSVSNAIERESKKYDLQIKQLHDTEKRDIYKVYGELITAFGYNVPAGSKKMTAENYYDENKAIEIPLDPTIEVMANAKKYFDKYSKLKRTFEAVSVLSEETAATLEHLKSIRLSLDLALSESDLNEIKEELLESGYIKDHSKRKSKKPEKKAVRKTFDDYMHFKTSDGYTVYVGKNNLQNDYLTFKVASANDWWFHAKGIPGSHVILKTQGEEIPDKAFEEAGALAAYFSDGKNEPKVEVDYIEKKNIKKPAGAKPGFVIYHSNYSLVAVPGKIDIAEMKDK